MSILIGLVKVNSLVWFAKCEKLNGFSVTVNSILPISLLLVSCKQNLTDKFLESNMRESWLDITNRQLSCGYVGYMNTVSKDHRKLFPLSLKTIS